MRTGKDAIDEPLVRIGRSILNESGKLIAGRGQAEQIKRQAADQRAAVGLP